MPRTRLPDTGSLPALRLDKTTEGYRRLLSLVREQQEFNTPSSRQASVTTC